MPDLAALTTLSDQQIVWASGNTGVAPPSNTLQSGGYAPATVIPSNPFNWVLGQTTGALAQLQYGGNLLYNPSLSISRAGSSGTFCQLANTVFYSRIAGGAMMCIADIPSGTAETTAVTSTYSIPVAGAGAYGLYFADTQTSTSATDPISISGAALPSPVPSGYCFVVLPGVAGRTTIQIGGAAALPLRNPDGVAVTAAQITVTPIWCVYMGDHVLVLCGTASLSVSGITATTADITGTITVPAATAMSSPPQLAQVYTVAPVEAANGAVLSNGQSLTVQVSITPTTRGYVRVFYMARHGGPSGVNMGWEATINGITADSAPSPGVPTNSYVNTAITQVDGGSAVTASLTSTSYSSDMSAFGLHLEAMFIPMPGAAATS